MFIQSKGIIIMNNITKEYLNFVENVNDEYWRITKDEEHIPVSLHSAGHSYNSVVLDLECVLCSTEDENLEEGIKTLDNFIKK